MSGIGLNSGQFNINQGINNLNDAFAVAKGDGKVSLQEIKDIINAFRGGLKCSIESGTAYTSKDGVSVAHTLTGSKETTVYNGEEGTVSIIPVDIGKELAQ